MSYEFNLLNLKECAPKAWNDFTAFYEEEKTKSSALKDVPFEQLPFPAQIGFFIKYFDENGVEPEVVDFQMNNLILSVEECFLNYENVLNHYS